MVMFHSYVLLVYQRYLLNSTSHKSQSPSYPQQTNQITRELPLLCLKKRYPLVNDLHFAMERSTMLSMGESTISMAMFNSKLLVMTSILTKWHRKGWS